MPSEIIEEELRDTEKRMTEIHESSASADAQADKIQDDLDHVKPVGEYAKVQSMKSYAEAGIHAMEQSDNNSNAKRDIFVAPENIFPEMGYGSHPEELIELVQEARENMIKMLTSPVIDDLHGRRDESGKLIKMENPYYMPNISGKQAEKEASQHIKATLDTQHIGMWRKHFMPRQGETKKDTDNRFKNWYMEMIKKMDEAKVIGHIHLADSMGAGHHALPAGQGELPVVDAINYLKSRGYTGSIVSEGYEEDRMGEGRILTETWAAFGSPVYSTHFGPMAGPRTWPQMHHGYFGQTQPPMFIYGAYSPSNDWSLWSEVQME